MTTFLLDSNVLIALAAEEHVHHPPARVWWAGLASFALCPIVEGALVRYMVRLGGSTGDALSTIQGFRNHPACEFWPDSLSYADLDLSRVRGHRQVTDAYLVRLAESHADSRLATFDRALAATYPVATELVPQA
jgi:toxin-antitoxin system PIN domain toxin